MKDVGRAPSDTDVAPTTEQTSTSEQQSERRNRPGPEALYGVKNLTEETAQRLASAFERGWAQIVLGLVLLAIAGVLIRRLME